MNRIILEESEITSDSFFNLNARKSNHILKTLKSKVGDKLKAGLLNSSLGTATVASIDIEKRQVLIRYEADKGESPLPLLGRVRIFSSIQRPQTVKKIIQLSANCGISELFFFPAEKSEFSYLNSSIWSERNLLDEVILGLEQGGRVFAPKITVLKNRYGIKENLTEGSRFLLDFNSNYLSHFQKDLDFAKSIQIILGPESGLTAKDAEYFLNLEFEKISVSENILRSEIALSYFLAQVELLNTKSFNKSKI